MGQYCNPDWKTHPDANLFNRQRVVNVAGAVLRALAHYPDRSTTKVLEKFARAFEKWLQEPIGASVKTQQDVDKGLAREPVLTRLAHPTLDVIKKISEATLLLAELENDGKFPEIEEYGEVFEDLAAIMRCEKCYGHKKYNRNNCMTGEQFTWGAIAKALVTEVDLKLPAYEPCRITDPLREEDKKHLTRSIRDVSQIIGIEYRAVVWQIIRYFIDIESCVGPKLMVRRGRWRELYKNMLNTRRLLRRKIKRERKSRCSLRRLALRDMAFVLKCALGKWSKLGDTVNNQCSMFAVVFDVEVSTNNGLF